MGQYWRVVVGNHDGKNMRIFIGPEGVCSYELLHHAHFYDHFTESVCMLLFNGGRVCWVGDSIADDTDIKKVIPDASCDEIWGNDAEIYSLFERADYWHNPIFYESRNKFLVNHSKRQFIDMSKYTRDCKTPEAFSSIFHPLPLLTAIKTNLSWDDLPKDITNYEHVGEWAWDIISVENNKPDSTYSELNYIFKKVN